MKRSWLAGTVVIGLVVAGCGDDAAGDAARDTGTTATTADSDVVDSGDDTPAELPKFCDLLTPEAVAEVVGAAVTLETAPFDACEFDQEDPRALSGSLGTTDVGRGNGGYETYQSGTSATMDTASRHDFDGLGDAAYVDIGTVFGGESLQVAGGVLVGTVVHTVNLSQGIGLGEDELAAIAEKLLGLMVEATS